MDNYFYIEPEEQLAVIQYGSRELGLPENIIEKDIWLCWVLKQVFSMPDAPTMAFKGGTSLSKVFNLIERFSEDVDITLDYRAFEEFDIFDETHSKTKLKKFSDRLKQHVKYFSTRRLVPYLQERLKSLPCYKDCKIEVDSSGEKVWIYYPTLINQPFSYVREAVLLELGGRNAITPSHKQTVKPYLSKVINSIEFPQAQVNVLAAERTFWEKATLIHVECQRGVREGANRLSRHWYDLVKLFTSDLGANALQNIALLEDVVAYKSIFYSASYANYNACLEGGMCLIPSGLEMLERDYKKMITAGMFYGQPITFNELINQIKALQERINFQVSTLR